MLEVDDTTVKQTVVTRGSHAEALGEEHDTPPAGHTDNGETLVHVADTL